MTALKAMLLTLPFTENKKKGSTIFDHIPMHKAMFMKTILPVYIIIFWVKNTTTVKIYLNLKGKLRELLL